MRHEESVEMKASKKYLGLRLALGGGPSGLFGMISAGASMGATGFKPLCST